jgi:putative acetyltransferase
MYLKPEVRNIGLGKKLMNDCLLLAKVFGYKNVYLESMPELKKAISAYEKLGFTYLDGPLGETGHFGCDLWMIKTLVD